VTTLVDSSVLLDIMAPSPWRQWSEEKLSDCLEAGVVAINPVIYAEIAVGFSTRRRLERALRNAGIRRLVLPWTSAWLVAEAFAQYRRAGGPRTLPLPDFFIGAHAKASGIPLLTRDAARIKTYFPEVALVCP
jgi:predicted nucleic acid-binding protein